MKRKFYIVVTLPLLSGCMAQSQIQSEYLSQQNLCRGQASAMLAAQPLGAGLEGQASAGSYFSECMNKAGWRVSVPKPGGQVAQGPVPNPPSGSPSTNPIASAAVPAPQAGATGTGTGGVAPSEGMGVIARQPHATTYAPQQAVVYPPSGAPSVNPSAAAARVAQPPVGVDASSVGGAQAPAPAQYLPVRPSALVAYPADSRAARHF